MQLEKSVYWKILRNQLTLMGTWNSSFTREAWDDWAYVLELLSRKRVMPEKLITHRFPLAELEKGFQIMRDKSEDYVKIMSFLS
jgi:L-iditol 2-dehydrogenase